MASSLQSFYEIKPEDFTVPTETMTVLAKNNKEYDVDIKAIPYRQFAQAKINSTFPAGAAGQSTQLDELTFCLKLCAAGIVNPPLSDAKLRAIHKVHSNEDLVVSLFTPQAIIKLGLRISQLSTEDRESLPTDEEGNIIIDSGVNPDLLEEAKN